MAKIACSTSNFNTFLTIGQKLDLFLKKFRYPIKKTLAISQYFIFNIENCFKSVYYVVMENIPNYYKIRENAENYYKKICKIQCPAFDNELIYFTSEGFNHLLYKKNVARTQKEQAVKLKLVAIAKEIIVKSTTYQEYDECLVEVTREKNGKKNRETILAKYWGIVAIVRTYRVKTIIRQLGNGNKHFWSVMPAWVGNQYRDAKFISNSKGNIGDD